VPRPTSGCATECPRYRPAPSTAAITVANTIVNTPNATIFENAQDEIMESSSSSSLTPPAQPLAARKVADPQRRRRSRNGCCCCCSRTAASGRAESPRTACASTCHSPFSRGRASAECDGQPPPSPRSRQPSRASSPASHATGDCCCCGTQRRTDAAGPGTNTRTRSGLNSNQSSLCRGGGLNSSRAAPYSDRPGSRHERDRWRRAADRASHPPSSPR